MDQPITGFLIAGEYKFFYPAQTQFMGDDLLVWNDHVAKPISCSLCVARQPNGGGIEASGP